MSSSPPNPNWQGTTHTNEYKRMRLREQGAESLVQLHLLSGKKVALNVSRKANGAIGPFVFSRKDLLKTTPKKAIETNRTLQRVARWKSNTTQGIFSASVLFVRLQWTEKVNTCKICMM